MESQLWLYKSHLSPVLLQQLTGPVLAWHNWACQYRRPELIYNWQATGGFASDRPWLAYQEWLASTGPASAQQRTKASQTLACPKNLNSGFLN